MLSPPRSPLTVVGLLVSTLFTLASYTPLSSFRTHCYLLTPSLWVWPRPLPPFIGKPVGLVTTIEGISVLTVKFRPTPLVSPWVQALNRRLTPLRHTGLIWDPRRLVTVVVPLITVWHLVAVSFLPQLEKSPTLPVWWVVFLPTGQQPTARILPTSWVTSV